MPRQRSFLLSRANAVGFWLLIGVALALGPALGHAQNVTVRLPSVENAPLGQLVEIPIVLTTEQPVDNLVGFDLALEFNRGILEFAGVQIGPDFFGRELLVTSMDECSQGGFVLRLLTAGAGQATPITTINDSTILATVLLRAPTDNAQACLFSPLRFSWCECISNVLYLDGNETILVSADVHDHDGLIITQNDPFPTYNGLPDSCLTEADDSFIRLRTTDFYNGGVTLSCNDTAMTQRARFATDVLHIPDWGSTVEIPIRLTESAGDLEIGGFDFMLRYDTAAYELLDVQPGQLYADCDWEYFQWRADTVDDCTDSECPVGEVRIVGVADVANPTTPSCLLDGPTEVAIMTFRLADYSDSLECRFVPLEWYWTDCSDNAVSNQTGDSLYLSRYVWDVEAYSVLSRPDEYPTPYGAQTECLPTGVIRAIDFVRGGADFRCNDPIESRGDINVNGIANEIADLILFSNYFFHGLSVFSFNMAAQVAATDVNADGMVLTFNDFVYLYRIVIGDAPPFPVPRFQTDTLHISHDNVGKAVSMSYAGDAGFLLMSFSGMIEPQDFLAEHEIWWYVDSVYEYTIVIILPDFGGSVTPLNNGLVMPYTGDAELVSVTAAWDGLSTIPVAITSSSSGDCCENRGNASGLFGPGGPVDIHDLTYLVTYLFDVGPPPVCIEEGNVDGLTGPSGPIDIADVTRLVGYLFQAGESLPPCPSAR